MSLRLFEGPAGVGKTTRLMHELTALLVQQPLKEHQKVLAVTKMHGSRRRLHDRLASLPVLARRYECSTLDSFAWRLLGRWSSLARQRFGELSRADDYAENCRRAGALLRERQVHQWVAETYPIVVIDEFQDCKNGQIAVVAGLQESATCLIAADEFQDLDIDRESAAVTWARQQCTPEILSIPRRTKKEGLLNAARALRSGSAVPTESGRGFALRSAYNPTAAAGFVSRYLTYWAATRDVAIISPARRETSSFVADVIARVEEKPYVKEKTSFGPHRISWEQSQEEGEEEFLSRLQLPSDPESIVQAEEIALARTPGFGNALRDWLDRQRKTLGKTHFTVAEIRSTVSRIHQRSRAYRRLVDQPVRGMTIHQAKNREFDSVIVLWPYKISGTNDRKRRLLYNAITRAKSQVLVIVEGAPSRLQQPPFVPSPPSTHSGMAEAPRGRLSPRKGPRGEDGRDGRGRGGR